MAYHQDPSNWSTNSESITSTVQSDAEDTSQDSSKKKHIFSHAYGSGSNSASIPRGNAALEPLYDLGFDHSNNSTVETGFEQGFQAPSNHCNLYTQHDAEFWLNIAANLHRENVRPEHQDALQFDTISTAHPPSERRPEVPVNYIIREPSSNAYVWHNSAANMQRGNSALEPVHIPDAEATQLRGQDPDHEPLLGEIHQRPSGERANYISLSDIEGQSAPQIPPQMEHSSDTSPPGGAVAEVTRLNTVDWNSRKAEICSLYVDQGCSAPMVMEIMAKRGFNATLPMYKRKFRHWGWITYPERTTEQTDRIDPAEPPIRRAARGSRRKASNLLSPTPELAIAPASNNGVGRSRRPQTRLPAIFNQGPEPPRDFGTDVWKSAILNNVNVLYLREIKVGGFKVTNPCVVEEPIHDELLAGVGTSLRNMKSLSPEIGLMGIHKAFHTLEGVVSRCGLFSLPAIWEAFLRMRRQNRPDLASDFLSWAKGLAVYKFNYSRDHELVQVLQCLQEIQKTAPEQLQAIIFQAYRRCIDHLKENEKVGVFNLTTLSLWADFVVYMDSSEANEAKAAVEAFGQAIRKSERDNGIDDDYTLELLGLKLYLLQSTPSMLDEAEQVALDMIHRVSRRTDSGEKLEGDLLVTWRDLKHTLADFRHAKKDDKMAVAHLEDYLAFGVADERDIIALEKLEKWYAILKNTTKSSQIRKWREESARAISQHENIPTGTGKAQDGDEGMGFKHEGSSEAPVVDDAEKRDDEVLEKDEVEDGENGNEAAQAEIQLIREQMEQLQSKLALLQKAQWA